MNPHAQALGRYEMKFISYLICIAIGGALGALAFYSATAMQPLLEQLFAK